MVMTTLQTYQIQLCRPLNSPNAVIDLASHLGFGLHGFGLHVLGPPCQAGLHENMDLQVVGNHLEEEFLPLVCVCPQGLRRPVEVRLGISFSCF